MFIILKNPPCFLSSCLALRLCRLTNPKSLSRFLRSRHVDPSSWFFSHLELKTQSLQKSEDLNWKSLGVSQGSWEDSFSPPFPVHWMVPPYITCLKQHPGIHNRCWRVVDMRPKNMLLWYIILSHRHVKNSKCGERLSLNSLYLL